MRPDTRPASIISILLSRIEIAKSSTPGQPLEDLPHVDFGEALPVSN
jgi:hypothetical protein